MLDRNTSTVGAIGESTTVGNPNYSGEFSTFRQQKAKAVCYRHRTATCTISTVTTTVGAKLRSISSPNYSSTVPAQPRDSPTEHALPTRTNRNGVEATHLERRTP
jgi:hypothetical protein